MGQQALAAHVVSRPPEQHGALRPPKPISPERPRRLRVALGIFRLTLAAIEIIALYGNFNYVLGFSSFATGNFFSYFTIQSAMVAVVMLVIAGVIAIKWHSDPP